MASTGIYDRLLRPKSTPEEESDQVQSDQVSDRISQLGLLTKGSALNEERLTGNIYNLAQGEYGAFDHTADHGTIHGTVTGAVFNKRCRIAAPAVITGVTFTDDGVEGAPELVHVAFPSRDTGVMFMNCTFIRSGYSPTCHVLVAAGSVAIFIGCTFRGLSQEAGDVIENQNGAAAAVQVIGSFNYTNNSDLGSNVTQVGVLEP